MNQAEIPLALFAISALALLVLWQYKPKKVTSWFNRLVRITLRSLILGGILGAVVFVGLLQVDITIEWIRVGVILAIASAVAGSITTEVFDWLWGK